MKKIFLMILIILIPCLAIAFSKNTSPMPKNITNKIVISNDNLIPNVDKRRIWKYLKKKQEEEERQQEENNSTEDNDEEENDNNPGLDDQESEDQK